MYLKLLTVLVSLVLFVVLAEIILRLIDPELGYKNQFFPINRDIDFPEFYQKDAKLFWKLRPSLTLESRWFSDLSYDINSRGLRGPEIESNKSGVRVLALGNSCTFGWGVSYAECWTKILEDSLKRVIAADAEIINAGIPGYSSHQGKIFFEQLLPLKPDVVLIMFGWNDHWPAGKNISDAEQKSPPQIVLALQNAFSSLRLYKLIRKITLKITETKNNNVRMDDITGKRRVSPEEFSANLKEIVTIARKNNITPILLVPPIASLENYNLGSISQLHILHHRYQEHVLRASEYLGVAAVNLQTEFDKHNDLFNDPYNDPIHFNRHGHHLSADNILPVISPLLKKNTN